METKQSRRNFFKTALTGISLLPLLKLSDAFAAKTETKASCPTPPKDPKLQKKVATSANVRNKSINYVEVSKVKGENCSTCKYYKDEKARKMGFGKGFGKCVWTNPMVVTDCAWCKKYKLDPKKKV